MAKSQCDRILEYMKTGKEIEPLTALGKFGCYRLGARIFDLRYRGHVIQMTKVYYKTEEGQTKFYASYKLIKEAPSEESVPAVQAQDRAEV